jgi:hypothetical protein
MYAKLIVLTANCVPRKGKAAMVIHKLERFPAAPMKPSAWVKLSFVDNFGIIEGYN